MTSSDDVDSPDVEPEAGGPEAETAVETESAVDETPDDEMADEVAADDGPAAPRRLSLEVEISDVGPCRKHVVVTVPRNDIDWFYEQAVADLVDSAEVPGFRKGRVPRPLIGRRFRRELGDEVKQKLLLSSLEQLTEDHELDPINEPNLDIESIDIPEEGDFEYEFDVEVRPAFELPDYRGLAIDRPIREITDEDVDNYLEDVVGQFGVLEDRDGPAESGDAVVVAVDFRHAEEPVRSIDELVVRLRPVLRFYDAELEGFDELMVGAVAGDERTATLQISAEAESVEMRGETVEARFRVIAVKRQQPPELNSEFLASVGVESVDGLREALQGSLERQVQFQQRQSTRKQVLEKITESADWELPEDLVAKQTENALRREILEMQQAGFTAPEIQVRENEIRQHAISNTRQAMKEHFVLDRVATQEEIDVLPADIETEIAQMAMQAGENPRRLRARLFKSGMIENLEAQIRERKAIDVILEHAEFNDIEAEPIVANHVEAVDQSVCQTIPEGTTVEPEATPEAEPEADGDQAEPEADGDQADGDEADGDEADGDEAGGKEEAAGDAD